MRRVWKVASIIGLIASIISVANLIIVGLTDGAKSVLALCFKWWNSVLHFLFGWATPYLAHALAQLARWVPINIQLFEHWYHVLVLMTLYVTGDVVLDWSRQYTEDKDTKAGQQRARNRGVSAALTVLIGYPLAIAVSVLAGTVDLTGTDRVGVAYAICGFALYQVFRSVLNGTLFPHAGKGRWKTFLHFFRRMPLMDVICGAIALAVGNYGPMPNLLVLLVFVILTAVLRNLFVPALFVISERGHFDVNFWGKLATVKLGLRVLVVIAGAVLVVLANAGL